jgi:hypothetical protein
MGSNRRYARHYDVMMQKRMAEIAVRPKPISLSAEELDTGEDPVVKPMEPIPVRAWTRYPETVVRIQGRAVEWNSRAVHVEWTGSDGEIRSTWVWASAVDRL